MPDNRKGSPRGALSRIHPAWAAPGVIGIVYLLQAATPLRLDDDAVDYLRMGTAIADGLLVPAVPVPVGYPVFLAFLDRAGLGSSFFFVLANCVFIALGLFAAWKILSDKTVAARWSALTFALLAIPVIKSVPIALPEAIFFGLSSLALWSMSAGHTASGRKRVALLGAAFALTAIATSVRMVGVALAPALLWSAAFQLDESGHERQTKPLQTVLLGVAGLLVAALLLVVAKSGTFSVYGGWTRTYYSHGEFAAQVAKHAATFFKIWGEVALNVPFSRFRESGGIFIAAGAISAALVVLLVRRSGQLTPARIYVLTYVVILALWPRPSPRLWAPIIPLIIGEVASVITRFPKARLTTALVGAYCAWFAMTGVAALAYTSRITFSSGDFANVYGRNGGMATPSVSLRDSTSIHRRIYNEEAKRLIGRYGGR